LPGFQVRNGLIPTGVIGVAETPARTHSLSMNYRALALVALVAIAVVSPMFFFGDVSGHDFQFHIASWVEVAGQWHQGIVYPRWAEWANWGYGEPRFIFYPPASWLLGAALGSVLPWAAAPIAYIWLALLIGGMGMWRLARDHLSPNEAAAAAVFFAMNPYNLALVYYRSDFAELLAAALFPLLLLGVFRIAREGWSRVPLLAFVFAGVWLANAPAAVIATYSVALLLLATSFAQRSVRPLIAGGTAMAAGFVLAAFYIVPAAWEQRWVQIGEAVTRDLSPQNNFIFTHTGDPEFILFNWKISAMACGGILVAAILAVFVARRRKEFPLAWWALLALGASSVFMMFWPSRLLWQFLPKLGFVQFPWRWLSALAVVFAFFSAAAFGTQSKRWILWVVLVVALSGTASAIASNTWWDSDDAISIADWIHSGLGYEGTDEYAPLGCARYELPGISADAEQPPDEPIPFTAKYDSASGAIAPASDLRFRVEQWTAEHRVLRTSSARPEKLVLRLLSYPAWGATIDNHAVQIAAVPHTGEILIPLPAGTHRVNVQFQRTADRRAGDALSAATALLLALWLFLSLRRRASRRLP
jgi:hypothetical protein